MNLSEENRTDLVKLRLQKSKETFAEVENHIKLCYWRTAANRLYYACYYIEKLIIN